MTKHYLTGALVVSLLINAVLLYQVSQLKNSRVAPDEQVVPETDTHTQQTLADGASYPFIRVVDGDTVIVGVDGRSEYVRLIGIDAPEPHDPGGPECYADESTEHLKQLLQTGTVTLYSDESQGERDTYTRLLAYVQLPDGTDVGEQMLRDGYAREFTYDQPYVRREQYLVAENEALTNESGLWAPETCR
jgi:micrococcal nuclease